MLISKIFFVIAILGIIISALSMIFLPEEKLQDDNNTGAKLMLILLSSLLMAGLNATAFLSDPLVTDIITP